MGNLGFVCISAGTCCVGYLIIRAMHPEVSIIIPLISYAFISYFVASLFMGVFGLAVDTSLQCFIACEEQKVNIDCVPAPLKNFVDNNQGSNQGSKNKDGE